MSAPEGTRGRSRGTARRVGVAYRAPMPRLWWLDTGSYRRFAARELTSVFVAAAAGLLIAFLVALASGEAAFEGFVGWLEGPGSLALHAVVLVAVLYHALTWLALTAQIQVVRLGARAVARARVRAGLVGLWALVSAGLVALYLLV